MKKIFKFVLVILCMLTIFFFSSDTGDESSKKSGFFVAIVQNIVGNKLDEKDTETVTFIVRKTAHFTIYFLLGFLLINLFREYFVIDKKMFFILILLCMLYACSDEIHQSFVLNRTGKIEDVFLDTVGASLGIFAYKKMFLKKKTTK